MPLAGRMRWWRTPARRRGSDSYRTVSAFRHLPMTVDGIRDTGSSRIVPMERTPSWSAPPKREARHLAQGRLHRCRAVAGASGHARDSAM